MESEVALGIWERDLQGKGWQFLATWTSIHLRAGLGLAVVAVL